MGKKPKKTKKVRKSRKVIIEKTIHKTEFNWCALSFLAALLCGIIALIIFMNYNQDNSGKAFTQPRNKPVTANDVPHVAVPPTVAPSAAGAQAQPEASMAPRPKKIVLKSVPSARFLQN